MGAPRAPSDSLLSPWLGELRDATREAEFREHDRIASGRSFVFGAFAIAIAVAVSATMDGLTFARIAPTKLATVLAARAVEILGVVGPVGAVLVRKRSASIGTLLVFGCFVVAVTNGIVAYEQTTYAGWVDNPFWPGLAGFLVLAVFSVPLRPALIGAGMLYAAPLVLHTAVLALRAEDLVRILTIDALSGGLGLTLAIRLNRTRRIEYAKLLAEREEKALLSADKSALEQQLLQAQKLEAIGRLAGGVAHDLNNLLTPILGYSDLGAHLTRDNPRLSEMLEQIKAAAERARDLTRQLLAFSRKQVLETRMLEIDALVREHEKMLRRLIREDVDIRLVLDAPGARVKADPTQITQVVLNLCANAADAMPYGGALTVGTKSVELAADEPADVGRPREGPYVVLAVTDTGMGMDEATRARIFEPFFTTKERGRGTGLGLATVYGIVEQHGGAIRVHTRPGIGTTFEIYLPVALAPASEQRMITHPPPAGGSETVLVVENEDAVRGLIVQMLKDKGYRVLSSASGAEAQATAMAHDGAIHLLLTDVIMPGMNGPVLANILERQRPTMKVLFMSGYADDVLGEHGVLDEGTSFLHKPFTVDGLTAKVRYMLDHDPAPGAPP